MSQCHGAERNGNVKIAREDVAMFITDPLRSVGKSLINIWGRCCSPLPISVARSGAER